MQSTQQASKIDPRPLHLAAEFHANDERPVDQKALDRRYEIETLPRQENGRMRGVILSGPPGIGKTHSLMFLAEEAVIPSVRLPMAARTKEEFGIYVVPDKKPDGTIVLEQPIIEKQLIPFLKENIGNGYGLILFDDVTLADPRLQSALLELVQFGRIGEHELGVNVLIGMTGNGVEDGCNAVEWNQALLGRSMYLNYKPNFAKWLELPCNEEMDPWIKGFLVSDSYRRYWCPTNLTDDELESVADASGKIASPRDWTGLGVDITRQHGGVKNYKGGMLFPTFDEYFSSYASGKSAAQFRIFSAVLSRFPSGEKLLNNPKSEWAGVAELDKQDKGAVFTVMDDLRKCIWRHHQEISESTKKGAERNKKLEDLGNKAALAVAVVMDSNQEMGAFTIRWLLKKVLEKAAEDNPGKKDVSCPFAARVSELAFGAYDENDPTVDQIIKDSQFDQLISHVSRLTEIISSNAVLGMTRS